MLYAAKFLAHLQNYIGTSTTTYNLASTSYFKLAVMVAA